MHKIERVKAALQGAAVDRPPFSFWYHFGLQHMPGTVQAEAEIGFYKAYDVDWLKVMNDYSYALPPGLESISTPQDWYALEPLPPEQSGFGEQLKALQKIHEALKGEVWFVDTIFSPWTVAGRLSRGDILFQHLHEAPEALKHGLHVIAQTLADYAVAAIERGAAGIFLSVAAATPQVMTETEYTTFVKPYDAMLLQAVQPVGRFNILHMHGDKLFYEILRDLPAHAVNWSSHYTPPSLQQGRTLFSGCILGGVDERQTSRLRPADIRAQILETTRALGTTKMMITPGCSVPTDTASKILHAFKQGVEELKNR
jgi:uroporphyrinogen decarboxylase